MEFDVSNLIYILATIVALLAGVLGKKKKPVRKAPANGETPRLTFFEKLESQLSGFVDEANMKNQQEPVFEEEELQVDGPVVFQESVAYQAPESSPEYNSPYTDYEGMHNYEREENSELINSEANRILDYAEGGLQLEELDEQGSESIDDVINDFGLEKAVIYSSILDRPDY